MLFVLMGWVCLRWNIGYAQAYPFPKVEYFPVKVQEEEKSPDIGFSSEELWKSPDIAYAFLTNPSLEAGQKYLLWQTERLKHLQKAMKILNQISQDL